MNEINGKVKISQLRAMVAVTDHGNFSSAALDLLSQSTISHDRYPGEELGVVLLFRGRHGATDTDGSRFRKHVRFCR